MTSTTSETVASDRNATDPPVFVLEPPRHGGWQPVVLPAGKYLIGSAADCQVSLAVDGILPHHALLIVGERKTLLKASDERTWINDWPAKESVVKLGDRISFGPVTFRFRAARPDELPRTLPPEIPSREIAAGIEAISAALPASAELPTPATSAVSALDDILPTISVAPLPRELDEREAKLEQRLTELTGRERAVTASAVAAERRQFDVNLAERELSEREQQWAARHADLQSFEQRLTNRERQLQELAAELARRTETLHGEAARIDEELKAREIELASARAEFAADANARHREWAERHEHLQTQAAVVAQREAAVARFQSQLTEEAIELGRQRSDFEAARLAAQQQSESASQTLDAKLRQLADRDHAVSERETDLSRRFEEFSAARTEFESAQATSAETITAEVQRLREELDRRGQELLQQQELLQDERNILDEDEAAFADRQTESAEFERHLSEQQQQLKLEREQFSAERTAFALEQERRATELDRRQAALANIERELRAQQTELADQATAEQQAALQQMRFDLDAERDRLNELGRSLESERAELLTERERLEAEANLHAMQQQELLAQRDELERQCADLSAAQEDFARIQGADQSGCGDEQADQLNVERAAFVERQAAWESERQSQQQTIEFERMGLQEEQARLTGWESALSDREAELARQFTEQPQPAASGEIEQQLRIDIERLNDEIARQKELFSAMEMQLAGHRQRQERDAAQWQSERMEWVFQREELERELAAANQKLARHIAKPVCIDLPATPESAPDVISENHADNSTELLAVPESARDEVVGSVDNSGEYEWAARDRQLAEEDEPAIANPVSNLRAELAKMFDLPEDASPDSALRSSALLHREPHDGSSEVEPDGTGALLSADDLSTSANVDLRSRLDEALTTSRPAASQSAAAEQEVAEPPPARRDASAEEDSIATYMERLLARNRRGSDEPDDEPAPQGRPSRERSAAVQSSAPLAEATTAETTAVAEVAPVVERRRSPRPRVAHDKDAQREHLQVFRQVANVSARTAVAKHMSKTLRAALIVKGVVTLVCSVAGVFFIHGWWFDEQAYYPQAMGCLLMAGLVGAELTRNLWHLKHAAKSLGTAGRNDSTVLPATNEDRTTDAPAIDPAAEPEVFSDDNEILAESQP